MQTTTGPSAGLGAAVILACGCGTDHRAATDGVIASDQGVISAVAAGHAGEAWWVRTGGTFELLRGTAGVLMDSAPFLDEAPSTNTALLSVSAYGAAWSPPDRKRVRWASEDGETQLQREATVTDLDAANDLVVWTDHNAGTLTWARPSGGLSALAERNLEFASGVATDGTRTWVIERLAAVMWVYPTPGAEPTVAAQWLGDNTMDLTRGAADLFWWNHATGELLALSKGELRSVLTTAPMRHGALAAGETLLFGVEALFGSPGDVTVWSANREAGTPIVIHTAAPGCDPVIAALPGDGGVLIGDCDGVVRSVAAAP